MKKDKTLFLDIDGVLTGGDTCVFTILEKDKILLLNKILEETGTRIVVSSNWRTCYNLDTLEEQFQEYGFKGNLHSFTPNLCWGSDISLRNAIRGDEIREWFRLHPHPSPQYAIVDDTYDFYADQPVFLVDPKTGLTLPVTRAIISHLNLNPFDG